MPATTGDIINVVVGDEVIEVAEIVQTVVNPAWINGKLCHPLNPNTYFEFVYPDGIRIVVNGEAVLDAT